MSNASINVRFANGGFSVERSTVVSLITQRLHPPVPYGRMNPWRLQVQDKSPQLTDKQMLMLFKPEVLSASVDSSVVIDRAFECLADHGYDVEGVSLLSGPYIGKQGIIERHYGQINKVYRESLAAFPPEAVTTFKEIFGVEPYSCDVLGGEEFMSSLCLSSRDMAQLWSISSGSGQVKKLAPGVYCMAYSSGRFMDKYLVNGFHAGQIENFCGPDRKTVAVSIRSGDKASSWSKMRSDFAGATDPAKAMTGSLRSWLLFNKRSLGIATVDMQFNGIHLTAGPLESIAEISNWFQWIKPDQTIMGRLLTGRITAQNLDILTSNPKVSWSGREKPLFDHTESMEPEEAATLASAIKDQLD